VALRASLNPGLARELTGRGIAAVSVVRDLGLSGKLDPEVLREVFTRYDDAVLVTGDDGMPAEHAQLIASLRATIAIVMPSNRQGQNEDAWERNIVHRDVHAMQQQDPGTALRYHVRGPRPWKPRRR